MKNRILISLLLFLITPLCHAGLASTIAKEFLEGAGRTAKNALDTPYIGPTIARAARPALKGIQDAKSVEFKILSYIYDERDACNSNDVTKYLKFTNSTTHPNSPVLDVVSDTTYIKRYKMQCEVDDVSFLGHGEGIDEISKYAYAEALTTITVLGLMKIQSKTMYIFKKDNSVWKFWDATFLDVNVELLTANWWLYNPVKRECYATSNENSAGEVRPIILLENSENMDCSTGGIKDNVLVVSCTERNNGDRSYYAYSPNKITCEEFGNKIMNIRNSNK